MPDRARRVPGTLPTAIVSGAVGILVATVAVITSGPWRGGQRVAERDAVLAPPPKAVVKNLPQLPPGPEHLPAIAALMPVFAGDKALEQPTPTGLTTVLTPLTALAGFGKHLGIAVADPASPSLLYGKSATDSFAPASTNKVVTALAALAALGPEHRIATRVVGPAAVPSATASTQAPETAIVLVGGGDPTLTNQAPAAGQPFTPASLDDLATQTAAALQKAGVKSVTLGYDASLYTGPPLQPTWSTGYTDGNVAPVTALMADEGRSKPADDLSPRVLDPAAAAAAAFAARLAAHGVTVTGTPSATTAPAGDAELARVESPRLADLVEHMLTVSDNDLAEALIRQVAVADAKPASFDGGVAAVRDVLAAKTLPASATNPARVGPGLDLTGYTVVDGSGLSRQDRVTPDFLVRALALAAATDHPELRPVLTGLPVAGFTGTLAENDRFTTAPASSAAGLVRAKTGSLTGVATLAGLVRDNDGQLLVFAFMADQAPDATAARAALDKLAAGITACGCE